MEVPAPGAEDTRPALSARVCPPRRGCTVPGCNANAARRARALLTRRTPRRGRGGASSAGRGLSGRDPAPSRPDPRPEGSPPRTSGSRGAGRGCAGPQPRVLSVSARTFGVHLFPGPDLFPGPPHLQPRGGDRQAPRRWCEEVNSILRDNRVIRPLSPALGEVPSRGDAEADLEGDGDLDRQGRRGDVGTEGRQRQGEKRRTP